MKLRAKFNLVIFAAFTGCFLFVAALLYQVFVAYAREAVLQNARLMMASADAIRDYTANELTPLLPADLHGEFVRQTTPAYAAQKNFKHFQIAMPGFTYREPALNPTNLSDRALDWEADIIQEFRNDPKKDEIVSERDTPTGRVLHLSRPISVTSEVCLECHGAPSAAPAALERTYGAASGFGWRLGETVGAQIVSAPMMVPLTLAREAYFKFLAASIIVATIIAGISNVLLHYLVIAPVKRITEMADAVSLGEENVDSYVKPGDDEISSLSVSFSRMRESLRIAMEMVKGLPGGQADVR